MVGLKAYANMTHQGPYLEINEDGSEIDLVNNLFMLLDGFGGSGYGDQAVKKVIETVKHFYSKVQADPDSTMPFFFGQKYTLEGNFLLNAAQYAHKMICHNNVKKEMGARGGAAGILAALAERTMTFLSTGNCRLYLLRQGHFLKVFNEDTLAWAAGDAVDLKFRSLPMSGFGLFNELYLETKEVLVDQGDLFCFLTDGMYARVEENEIKHILENSSGNLQDKINSMVDLSNNRGNLDNQSAILLQF